MDRWQAQYSFWSSFGIPAYEENSVPAQAAFPYITYEASASGFDENDYVSASIWTRSTSWKQADTLADTIEAAIEYGGKILLYNRGMIWVTAGEPFSQNMGDPNDSEVKRKLLSVTLHFV